MRLTFGAFSLELCEGNAQVTSLSFHGQELLSCRQSHPVFSLVALDENNHRVALVPADGRKEADASFLQGKGWRSGICRARTEPGKAAAGG